MITKNKIISRSFEIYKKRGFKSVTINDLAYELGMSKKTIYCHFESKEEIVNEIVHFYIGKLNGIIETSSNPSNNAIYRMVNIYHALVENFSEINPAFFYTLEKYYYKSYQIIIQFRDKIYFESIKGMINKGIEEGFFRQDIPVENLLYGHMNYFTMVLDARNVPEHIRALAADDLFQLLLNAIRGMTTLKGYQLLNKRTQPDNQLC